MNLDEYRAMKQAEAEGGTPNAQTEQVSTEPVLQGNTETQQSEPTQPTQGTEDVTQTQSEEPKPQVFEIDGQEVSLEELQRGYLRQSDYTRKTQEIARKERELAQAQQIMEAVQKNPEIASQVGYNPEQARVQNLEAELFDMRLAQEINTLSTKYTDFDTNEVIDFALSRQMESLEDAYLLNKHYKSLVPTQVNTAPQTPSIDVEALKAQIRAELLAEQNTSTIISGGGSAPTPAETPQLTPDELKVAKLMKMTPEEYIKWR